MFSIESSNLQMILTTEIFFCQNQNHQEKLWKVINELAFNKKEKKSTVIPSKLISDDEIVQDPQSICEIMNSFFVNVGKNLADKLQSVTNKLFSFHDNLPVLNTLFFLLHHVMK